ncbi:MAG: hypothetical protein ACP5L5_11520 [Vulcanisaeta sp.]|uniref:hypothetical protein n=1 Tax=Vulcanisaeta sp. TaxID=2020871 RepID=UPI003D0B6801
MVMGSRTKWLMVAALIIVAAVVASLFIRFFLVPRSPPAFPLPNVVDYGLLYCNDDVIIPGNTMIILYLHPHGSVEVNNVVIYVSFPIGIINETLSALSRLTSSEGSMIIGVYVNGRLVAFNNKSEPVMSLINTVNHPYFHGNETMNFWQFVKVENATSIDTTFGVGFSTINVTPSDTIAVVIYSAVPYALPSCVVNSEVEEVKLMVENNWIGLLPLRSNGTPTAEQLYEEGRYITEEPTIYIVNVSKPIQGLPQTLPTNAKPYVTGIAPSYAIGQALPPTMKVGGG